MDYGYNHQPSHFSRFFKVKMIDEVGIRSKR